MGNGVVTPREGETSEEFLMRASSVVPPNEGETEDDYLQRVSGAPVEPGFQSLGQDTLSEERIQNSSPGRNAGESRLDREIREERRRATGGPVDRFVQGMGKGALEAVSGAGQMLMRAGESQTNLDESMFYGGWVPEYPVEAPDSEKFTKYLQEEYFEPWEQATEGDIPARLGEFTGSVAATAPVPGGAYMKAGGTLAKIALPALAGAGVGAAQFAPEDEDRARNALFGGLFGAGGVLAARFGGKALNALRRKYKNASTDDLIKLAEKHYVPLSFGDISQGPGVQATEVTMEKIPGLGTAKFRKEGAEKVTKAANTFQDKFRREMMEKGEELGDDWNKILQTSAKNKAAKVRKKASELYDDLIPRTGNKTVNMNATKSKVSEILEDQDILPDNELISVLNGVQEALDSPKNFEKIRRLRSKLGKVADKLSLNNRDAARMVGDVKRAVEKDIDSFFKRKDVPKNLRAKFKKAKDYYKNEVVPFKDKSLAKAMKSDKSDEVYSAFIKRGGGDRAKNFYNALDEKGQSAVRYGMIDKAMEAATKDGKPFSPARFNEYFERMDKPMKEIFQGKAKAELDGFRKLMRHAERYGQYMENPPTGQRLINVLLGGGAFASAGAATMAPVATGAAVGSAIGTTAILKALFTTDFGKRILLASSRIEPGNKTFDKLLNKLGDRFSTMSAAAGVEATEK